MTPDEPDLGIPSSVIDHLAEVFVFVVQRTDDHNRETLASPEAVKASFEQASTDLEFYSRQYLSGFDLDCVQLRLIGDAVARRARPEIARRFYDLGNSDPKGNA